MKYLKIHSSDLPWTTGLVTGVVYFSINDAFFNLRSCQLSFSCCAIYYCAKVMPMLEKTIGHARREHPTKKIKKSFE